MEERILAILQRVQAGELDITHAVSDLSGLTDIGFAVVDDARGHRTGLPEVVFGQGKTPQQIAGLFEHFKKRGVPALATRVDPDKAIATQKLLTDSKYEACPRLLWRVPDGSTPFLVKRPGPVWVLSAGTADLPVAEEAARCGEWFGLEIHRSFDVGVAGLHRLLSKLTGLQEAKAVIVVAGMEGALPSVVAGLVPSPVIAVPTSIGYGAHLGGLTTLLAMVNSCAAGVSVVNIDNGFGAAQVAWRILGISR